MTDAKMCPTIAVDADGLRTLRERARAIGTLDAWADVALEWANHAEKEIARLRAASSVEAEEVARLRACVEAADAMEMAFSGGGKRRMDLGYDDRTDALREYRIARAALSGGGNG